MIRQAKTLILASLLITALFCVTKPTSADVYVPGAKVKTHTPLTTEYTRSTPSTTSEPEEKTEPVQQKFANALEELKVKVKAFSGNAESMDKIIANCDEKTVNKEKSKIIKIAESMQQNNAQLQKLTKTLAGKEKNDQIRNILTRGILPNLQNVNRQLARVKQAAENDDINYSNMKQQVSRVDESIKQVIERLENYEKH